MSHKPCALVADAKHPMKLMGTHALLAGANEVIRHKPLVQRDVTVFENGSDGHAELLAASSAIEQSTPSMGFSTLFCLKPYSLAAYTAMRANRAIGPAFRFEVFPCFI